MYLAALNVKGFRMVSKSLNLQFRPGLNVLVGPNNVGKTAVVDGLYAHCSQLRKKGLSESMPTTSMHRVDMPPPRSPFTMCSATYAYERGGLSPGLEANAGSTGAPTSTRHICGYGTTPTERPVACVPNVGAAIMKKSITTEMLEISGRCICRPCAIRHPDSSPAVAASLHALSIGSPATARKRRARRTAKEI